MKTKVEFYIIEDIEKRIKDWELSEEEIKACLLYTSPSPRDS